MEKKWNKILLKITFLAIFVCFGISIIHANIEKTVEYYEMGRKYERAGEISKAIEYFKKALDVAPEEEMYVLNMAIGTLLYKNE